MPTGSSSIYYPKQPKPLFNLALDNSYFRLKLHDTQAFFQAPFWSQPGFLTLSSSVESSFQPGIPTQSLHKIGTLQRNTPCRLGISKNLTDWLPARAGDSLRVTLEYRVMQDEPLKNLVAQMEQMDLETKVSLVRPDWAVAIKVSSIVGKLLSYLAQEGSQHEIFTLTLDLNLVTLKSGYYAVIGSHQDAEWTSGLQVDSQGKISALSGQSLSRLSYAVFEVLALPRRGEEIARNEPWWELLQLGKEEVIDANFGNDLERSRLLNQWRSTLTQVRKLARQQREFLLKEIDEIIQQSHTEVSQKLAPSTKGEAFGDDELPQEWQELLGVATLQQLQNSVRDYQDALEVSQELIKQYE